LGEEAPPPCGRCDNCLRSREAALAAAREASRLESGVLEALTADDDLEESEAPARRQVRARVIRIDEPPAIAEPAAAAPAAIEARAAAGAKADEDEGEYDEAEYGEDGEYEDDEYEDGEYEDDE